MNWAEADHVVWYSAMTLAERHLAMTASPTNISGPKIDEDLSEQRLARWRSQEPFPAEEIFTKRLSVTGLTEADLRTILSEPIDGDRLLFPEQPDWFTTLSSVYSSDWDYGRTVDVPTVSWLNPTRDKFLCALYPLILRARQQLSAHISSLQSSHGATLPFHPDSVIDLFQFDLFSQLSSMIERTFVLEINIARLRGELLGQTSQMRYRSFIDNLQKPSFSLELLKRYPVLARHLVETIEQWTAVSVEFLDRLLVDSNVIQSVFSRGTELGVLVGLTGGVGDKHRNGRSVRIATFSSGVKVVYKPRSLAVDVHVQELLDWLNSHGQEPALRNISVLDRGSYGWCEFVEAYGCSTRQEIERFYRRQGSYLALMYTLQATDFHHENLIASGEHPVLVDLESLFHPRIDEPEDASVSFSTLASSVMRVGLLPRRVWANAGNDGVDLSGLGGGLAGQLTPFTLARIEAPGTDEMHFSRGHVSMPGRSNRPMLGEAEVDLLEFQNELTMGFAHTYRLLQANQRFLLARHGPIGRFATDEVRTILRPTRTYGMLLTESFHPDVLRDALDRDRHFDHLWKGVVQWPHLERVVEAERDDLLRGDIPIFTTRVDSRHLWTSTGERIEGFLTTPGVELVRQRLMSLSDTDLERQVWIMRASLSSLATDAHDTQPSLPPSVRSGLDVSHERLVDQARAVGDRLEARALRDEHGVAWLGVVTLPGSSSTITPLGLDLYSGLPGIALFLAHLGVATGEARYTALAHETVETISRSLDRTHKGPESIGGFDGWGGLIYVLTHLGVLWQRRDLIVAAEECAGYVRDLVGGDEALDVIGGAAGCIGGLLCLHRVSPSARVIAAATACGEHLISRMEPQVQGAAWPSRIATTQPLTGMSHGAAGISWALLQLAAATDDQRFRCAGLAGIAYERSVFSPQACNWPDFRDPVVVGREAGTTNFAVTWCHGAPGIGLARLLVLQYLNDPDLHTELNLAIATVLTRGFGSNHSLCHGELGNLEVLLQARDRLGRRDLTGHIDRIIASIAGSIEQGGWICGVPTGVETPGLLDGIAGIGYGLLRLADPIRVPSVLSLAPPHGHEQAALLAQHADRADAVR